MLYFADGNKHKNHIFLFNAMEILAKKYNLFPELIITLDLNLFSYLNEKINILNKIGININNIGNVNHTKLLYYYNSSKYYINSSLKESLGLTLIEASHYNCCVLSINLDYVKEVITPSFYFSKDDPEDLAFLLYKLLYLHRPHKVSNIKIENQIQNLINL
jgi:glycosyltransferase involved in cell wall biosynthesis